jgi:glycerophosphoryl diester phosphodiesterase
MLLLRRLGLLWVVMLAACSSAGEATLVPAIGPEVNSESVIGENVNESDTGALPAGFDVQGHRGARGLRPENTLPAFETALDLGVTTLEMDLHFTADQVVVVWHDAQIDKAKCGLDPSSTVETRDPDSLIKWGSELMISQLTLQQVQAYRCDRNPDPDRYPQQKNGPTALAGDDYRIITLAKLFDFVAKYSESELKSPAQRENARQVRFNIETKREVDSPKTINDGFDGINPGPFELEILRLLDEYGLEDRVTIQSFDHRSLWAVRSVNENISLAALTSRGVPNPPGYAKQGATIWSPRYSDVSPAMVSKSHKSGLLVIPWTVDILLDLEVEEK